MKLKFIKTDNERGIAKATIQKTGRLGFSMEAIKKLQLRVGKSVSIAIDEEELSNKNIYIRINNELEEGAFILNKAGDYYYLNTKYFFDSLGINFRNKSKTYIYDIVDFEFKDEKLFKLIMREVKRRKLI